MTMYSKEKEKQSSLKVTQIDNNVRMISMSNFKVQKL